MKHFLFTLSLMCLATPMYADLLGPQVKIYGPDDDPTEISREINAIHDSMLHDQFSAQTLRRAVQTRRLHCRRTPQRALLHADCRTRTHPYDVKLSNVHTPSPLRDDNGTCTFWRSAENFSVIGPESYDEPETFEWAVSQAAPLRRVYSERTLRTQQGNGWVSGGYAADCYFAAPAGSDHQQQWYYRNSVLNKGRGLFREEKYNYCFQGVELGPEVDMAGYTDNWDRGGNVTYIPTTPVVREKPFLFIDTDGRYKVFRPALRRDSKSLSYSRTSMGEGTAYDLVDDFLIVKPGMEAAR